MANAAAFHIEPTVVELAQRGDADAFDAIYRQYHPLIAGYLCRLVGNPETAADLTQDVFVNAYQAIGRTQPGLNLKSWLFTIATNRAITHHRRWRIRQWLPIGNAERQSDVDAVETRCANREELGAAMAALPKEHVACFLLHARDGFSYEEIGSILGIPASTAKVRAFRVRTALADALMAREEGTP